MYQIKPKKESSQVQRNKCSTKYTGFSVHRQYHLDP